MKLKKRRDFFVVGDFGGEDFITTKVKGYEIDWDIHPSYKFFIHYYVNADGEVVKPKYFPLWTVSEMSTGCKVKTFHQRRKDTIQNAYDYLKKKSENDTKKAVAGRLESIKEKGLPVPVNS